VVKKLAVNETLLDLERSKLLALEREKQEIAKTDLPDREKVVRQAALLPTFANML
jgi:hypothetical protein